VFGVYERTTGVREHSADQQTVGVHASPVTPEHVTPESAYTAQTSRPYENTSALAAAAAAAVLVVVVVVGASWMSGATKSRSG